MEDELDIKIEEIKKKKVVKEAEIILQNVSKTKNKKIFLEEAHCGSIRSLHIRDVYNHVIKLLKENNCKYESNFWCEKSDIDPTKEKIIYKINLV